MVNLTATMTAITLVMPGLIDRMPGGISDLTKDWLRWTLEFITAVVGIITALSKKSEDA